MTRLAKSTLTSMRPLPAFYLLPTPILTSNNLSTLLKTFWLAAYCSRTCSKLIWPPLFRPFLKLTNEIRQHSNRTAATTEQQPNLACPSRVFMCRNPSHLPAIFLFHLLQCQHSSNCIIPLLHQVFKQLLEFADRVSRS